MNEVAEDGVTRVLLLPRMRYVLTPFFVALGVTASSILIVLSVADGEPGAAVAGVAFFGYSLWLASRCWVQGVTISSGTVRITGFLFTKEFDRTSIARAEVYERELFATWVFGQGKHSVSLEVNARPFHLGRAGFVFLHERAAREYANLINNALDD